MDEKFYFDYSFLIHIDCVRLTEGIVYLKKRKDPLSLGLHFLSKGSEFQI